MNADSLFSSSFQRVHVARLRPALVLNLVVSLQQRTGSSRSPRRRRRRSTSPGRWRARPRGGGVGQLPCVRNAVGSGCGSAPRLVGAEGSGGETRSGWAKRDTAIRDDEGARAKSEGLCKAREPSSRRSERQKSGEGNGAWAIVKLPGDAARRGWARAARTEGLGVERDLARRTTGRRLLEVERRAPRLLGGRPSVGMARGSARAERRSTSLAERASRRLAARRARTRANGRCGQREAGIADGTERRVGEVGMCRLGRRGGRGDETPSVRWRLALEQARDGPTCRATSGWQAPEDLGSRLPSSSDGRLCRCGWLLLLL